MPLVWKYSTLEHSSVYCPQSPSLLCLLSNIKHSLAVAASIWNGGLALLLELNCLMVYIWTFQEPSPDLIVIIKACNSISEKVVRIGGKWINHEKLLGLVEKFSCKRSTEKLRFGSIRVERKEHRWKGKAGITVWAGGIWGLPQAHFSFILRTHPLPSQPPLDSL